MHEKDKKVLVLCYNGILKKAMVASMGGAVENSHVYDKTPSDKSLPKYNIFVEEFKNIKYLHKLDFSQFILVVDENDRLIKDATA